MFLGLMDRMDGWNYKGASPLIITPNLSICAMTKDIAINILNNNSYVQKHAFEEKADFFDFKKSAKRLYSSRFSVTFFG